MWRLVPTDPSGRACGYALRIGPAWIVIEEKCDIAEKAKKSRGVSLVNARATPVLLVFNTSNLITDRTTASSLLTKRLTLFLSERHVVCLSTTGSPSRLWSCKSTEYSACSCLCFGLDLSSFMDAGRASLRSFNHVVSDNDAPGGSCRQHHYISISLSTTERSSRFSMGTDNQALKCMAGETIEESSGIR